ncbi:MAG: YidC/Oxa1 family membrane protein insertase [Peptococcaceae bacterium]|nr:YidC/Oxa1 family membrane protein insertase [Peptococcaceae bacterium]
MFEFFQPFIDVLSSILDAFYAFTVMINIPSYAIAIVLFTIVIRLALVPLGWNQTVSMRKMKEIQPIQAKLQKKYGNRKEVYQQKVMELYKRRKVNPAMGCFPMLIQLPIIMCFYWMLTRHPYGDGPEAKFFGLKLEDTIPFAADDFQTYVYLIWPILVGVSAFISTKLTTSYTAPKKKEEAKEQNTKKKKGADLSQNPGMPGQGSQKFMNIFMAGFMAFIMTVVPSGMGFYFITYNGVQLLQTIVINKILDVRKKKEDEIKRAEAV